LELSVLVGLGMGAEADVMPLLVSRYFGIPALGELFGYAFSSYTLGTAAGPIVMATGFDAIGSYRIPLGPLVVALIAATAEMLTLPNYPRRLSRGGSNDH
jgi:MFS family permease